MGSCPAGQCFLRPVQARYHRPFSAKFHELDAAQDLGSHAASSELAFSKVFSRLGRSYFADGTLAFGTEVQRHVFNIGQDKIDIGAPTLSASFSPARYLSIAASTLR